MYNKVDTNLNFVDREKQVREFWKDNDIFKKSMEQRKQGETYTFYDGPPTANGKPHIGHVETRTIKDMIPRFQAMKGKYVPRKAGWDTHGLPVELSVEKALGITKEDIGKKISVADYNAACRKDVMKYTKEWEDLTHKMGYWVDMKHPYITYDNRYIETLWWLLKHPTLFSGSRNRIKFTRTESTGMLSGRERYNSSGTIQNEEPQTGNGTMGHSLFPGMDHYSMDITFKYRTLCRP